VTLPDLGTARIAVLGAGREGQAAWRYLRERYPAAALTLVDEQALAPALVERLGAQGRVLVGPFAATALASYDLLVRSPGISPYREELRRARAAGVAVTSGSSLWFADHAAARTICVTGTKGKSTTSALLAHVLAAGGQQVRLAGNIGRPLLDCDDRGVDWWVIELSSYQIVDLEAAPTVSVLLNLSSEHLDWHGGEAAYRRDKLRLAELAGDRLVVANAADPVLHAALAGKPRVTWFNDHDGIGVRDGRVYDGDSLLAVGMPPGLPGAHNLSNVAAVLTVVRAIGGDVAAAAAAVAGFEPLPHRLQLLGERDGLRYVNDSISTAPVATAAALESYAGQPVTLLVGGLDRGIDWAPFVPTFAARAPLAVIGLPDNGARIVATLRAGGFCPERGLHEAASLEAAVDLARGVTPPGGVVLLSPGAPSFPRFRDFRERGCRFAACSGFAFEDREPF